MVLSRMKMLPTWAVNYSLTCLLSHGKESMYKFFMFAEYTKYSLAMLPVGG